jgi:hypothetical protein
MQASLEIGHSFVVVKSALAPIALRLSAQPSCVIGASTLQPLGGGTTPT